MLINNITSALARPPRCPQILQITVDDPVVLDELSSRDSLESQRQYGEELMELGARVARTQRPTTEGQKILEVVSEISSQFERQLEKTGTLLQTQVDTVGATLASSEMLLRRELESARALLERETANRDQWMTTAQSRIEKALKTMLDGVEGNVNRAQGDSERLAELFKAQLQLTLEGLDDQVGRAEQVIASGLAREEVLLKQQDLRDETSNRKGMEFEHLIHQDLLRFGSGRGDLVERTGATTSAGTSSKKGDLFYQLKVGDRYVPVVIECKDEQLTMSGANPFRLNDLATSIQERAGSYGIVVANLDPNSRDGQARFPVLQFFGNDRFVVLVDRDQESPVVLETVLNLIHRSESQRRDSQAPEIDREAVAEVMENITITSSAFSRLKGTCTSMKTSLTKLREDVEVLGDTLEAHHDQLRVLLGLAA